MLFDADNVSNSDGDDDSGIKYNDSDDSSNQESFIDKEEQVLDSDWSVNEFNYSNTRMTFEAETTRSCGSTFSQSRKHMEDSILCIFHRL
jgi:hypothetical protein